MGGMIGPLMNLLYFVTQGRMKNFIMLIQPHLREKNKQTREVREKMHLKQVRINVATD